MLGKYDFVTNVARTWRFESFSLHFHSISYVQSSGQLHVIRMGNPENSGFIKPGMLSNEWKKWDSAFVTTGHSSPHYTESLAKQGENALGSVCPTSHGWTVLPSAAKSKEESLSVCVSNTCVDAVNRLLLNLDLGWLADRLYKPTVQNAQVRNQTAFVTGNLFYAIKVTL